MFGIRRKQAAAPAGAPLDDVVRRMRPLPYDSLTRWSIVEEVAGRPTSEVLPVVRRLLGSGRPEDELIGVQLTDNYFSDLDEPLPGECFELEPMLRRLCEDGQPPELVAAVLGPWCWVAPDEGVVLRRLVRHPDGQVRARAVDLLASSEDLADVELVADVLTHDADPRVRCSAAEALASAHLTRWTEEEEMSGELSVRTRQLRERLWATMRPLLRDPEARVRAAALDSAFDHWGTDTDVARAEEQLLAELVDLNVDASMVSLAGWVRDRKPELLERLTALQRSDWPARNLVPDRYPDEPARRALLAGAVDKATPRAKGRWPLRR